MKRALLMLLTMGLLLLLTSCRIPPEVFRDDDEVVQEALGGLLSNVRAGDYAAAQEAFAPALRGDALEGQLHALAELLPPGEAVLLRQSGTMGSRSSHAGERVWELAKSYTYSFDGEVVCIFIRIRTYDTAEPDNEGIYSVYVVRGEDHPDYMESHYWRGSGLPGLHLESGGGE